MISVEKGWNAKTPQNEDDDEMRNKMQREYVNSFYQVLLPKLSSDCSIYSYTFWFVCSATCVCVCSYDVVACETKNIIKNGINCTKAYVCMSVIVVARIT